MSQRNSGGGRTAPARGRGHSSQRSNPAAILLSAADMPETTPQTSALPTPAAPAGADPTPTGQGTRVLLAVSSDDARERRLRKLMAAGLDVLVARTSFETVVKATCTLPDVILLDPTLGRDVLVETRRLLVTCPSTAHIPVVRLTARRTVPRRLLATLAA